MNMTLFTTLFTLRNLVLGVSLLGASLGMPYAQAQDLGGEGLGLDTIEPTERLQLNGIEGRLEAGDPLFDADSNAGLLDGGERQFKPIFNGEDLEGWMEIGEGEEANWHVEDSILFTTGATHSWLATEEEYGDFELSLEFRYQEGGNSGVFIRAPKEGNPAFDGMEIQILDDDAERWEGLADWQYSGSLYAIAAPSEKVTKPAGEWQHFFIRCEGPHIQIRYNGVDVVDVNLDEAESYEEYHPGMERERGHIGLQDHGDPMEFRNINIRELD